MAGEKKVNVSHLESAYGSLSSVRICVMHRNMGGNNKSLLVFLDSLPLQRTKISKGKESIQYYKE